MWSLVAADPAPGSASEARRAATWPLDGRRVMATTTTKMASAATVASCWRRVALRATEGCSTCMELKTCPVHVIVSGPVTTSLLDTVPGSPVLTVKLLPPDEMAGAAPALTIGRRPLSVLTASWPSARSVPSPESVLANADPDASARVAPVERTASTRLPRLEHEHPTPPCCQWPCLRAAARPCG